MHVNALIVSHLLLDFCLMVSEQLTAAQLLREIKRWFCFEKISLKGYCPSSSLLQASITRNGLFCKFILKI